MMQKSPACRFSVLTGASLTREQSWAAAGLNEPHGFTPPAHVFYSPLKGGSTRSKKQIGRCGGLTGLGTGLWHQGELNTEGALPRRKG